MPSFVPPPIADVVYRDASGAVIDYGNRWPESPADEAYSRTSNLDRFAHLHEWANAVIEWLVNEYDRAVTDAAASVMASRAVVRTVTVTPPDHSAGALTFGFTDFPGLIVGFGRHLQQPYPVCGCDACDDSAARLEEQLEDYVLGFLDGGTRESADGSLYWIEGISGGGTGSGYGGDLRQIYNPWSRRAK